MDKNTVTNVGGSNGGSGPASDGDRFSRGSKRGAQRCGREPAARPPISSRGERKKYSNVKKKKKLAVVMCQRSPSKVSGLFIKISALFANFRFVAVLYMPYLVPSIFFDARLVRSSRLVKSNKMQQNVAKTEWELTKVARIGRSRSVYGQKRVEGSVGQSREPKLSVCCLRISAHPFLAKNRPGAPVFGHCP